MPRKVSTHKPDQEALLRLFETDCDRAWEQFLNEFSQVIRKVVRWKLGPGADEDCIEEIYVKILQKLNDDGCRRIKEFKQFCKLSTWLTSIAVNQIRDEMKTRSRNSLLTVPLQTEDGQDDRTPPSVLPTPLEQVIQQEDVEQLRACMGELPAEEKLRLLRRFADRRKLREIAQLEGVSEGAVDGRIQKSLGKLRACMKKRRK